MVGHDRNPNPTRPIPVQRGHTTGDAPRLWQIATRFCSASRSGLASRTGEAPRKGRISEMEQWAVGKVGTRAAVLAVVAGLKA